MRTAPVQPVTKQTHQTISPSNLTAQLSSLLIARHANANIMKLDVFTNNLTTQLSSPLIARQRQQYEA